MAARSRKALPRDTDDAPAEAAPMDQRSALRAGQDLDRLIHERVRLGILSALAVNDKLGFNELKQILGLTDGNLSVHARKLEEAGYLHCHKSFVGRLPCTHYVLSAAGRAALEQYLAHMEAIIAAVKQA